MLYFAYGSNLHPTRLGRRVPSATLEGVGVLRGRRLAFHKRGYRDGSGKSDVPEASPDSRVHGALFRISADQKRELARIEGVGAGYEEASVTVELEGSRASAVLFLAHPNFVDPTLAPFDWYKALVIEGARFHCFPAEYIAAIEAIPSIADPDADRAAMSWAMVEAIGGSASSARTS